MIFSRGWPSWFGAARSPGYHVSLILMQDATWKGLIKHFSPSTNVVVCVSIPLIALLKELYKESRGGAPDGPVCKSSAATD